MINSKPNSKPKPRSKINPLIEVQKHGQSIWYDFISRDLLLSGELRRLVREDGVLGVTSNPAIFEKAIAGSDDYDPAIQALASQGIQDPKAAFERLAIQDVQLGCDVLRGVYDRTRGGDGFVSMIPAVCGPTAALSASRSTSPSGPVGISTVVQPHIVAVAGFVPCAASGTMISRRS